MARFNRNGLARLGGALCVVLVAGAVVGPVAVSSGKSPAPTQAQIASRLAQQLTTARTPAARYQALVAIMRALGIGVYRGNGRPIVRGAERTAKDLYVYDFVLKALAADLAKHKTTTVNAQAALLNGAIAPLKLRAKITGALLRSVMQSSARWAVRHPQSDQAFVDLLIRDVGLRTVHQDVANPPALGKMKLDSVQASLITTQLTAAIIDLSRRHALRTAATTPPARSASTLGDLCSNEQLKHAVSAWKMSRTVVKLVDALDKGKLIANLGSLGTAIVVRNLTVGAFTAYIIDQLVEFKAETKTVGRTHYGPGGHFNDAGKHLSYRAHLQMTADIPELVAKCGYLAGLAPKTPGIKLPPSGDLAGVPVDWHYASYVADKDKLEPHGTVLRLSATDHSGDTWLEFAPKDELVPNVGTLRSSAGNIVANANVQEYFGGPLLGLTSNFWSLLPPKYVSFYYDVSGHRARGYQIQVSPGAGTLRDDFGYGYDDLSSIAAKVCGENPYAQPWTASAVAKNHLGQTELLTGTVSFSGADAWSPVETTYQDGITWELKMAIKPALKPVMMMLEGQYNRHGSTAAQITENPGCPPV